MTRALALVLLCSAACCDDGGAGSGESGADTDSGTTGPGDPESWVERARTDHPTLLELQASVITPTCSPNPGVCHRDNNFPDLRTAAAADAIVGQPCNLELPDPLLGFNGCERAPDRLEAEGWAIDIAWIASVSAGRWRLGLRTTPDLMPNDPVPVRIVGADGQNVVDTTLPVDISLVLDGTPDEGDLLIGQSNADYQAFVDSVVAGVIGGDPNRDGIWGASDEAVPDAALVWPGDLERSYLWGRITATVPGTRMPLANGQLTNPQYVAIACWIEGLAQSDRHPTDAIDYDHCAFAANPEDLAVDGY